MIFSNYNHSGNFKQHLFKHERESGSISAMLVAKAKEIGVTNLLDVDVAQLSQIATVHPPKPTTPASKVSHVERDPSRQLYECEQCGRKINLSIY